MSFGTFAAVYDKAETVRRWLGMGDGAAYHEVLLEWRRTVLSTLRTAKEPVDLYRAQGRLEVLDRLIELREELSKRDLLEPRIGQTPPQSAGRANAGAGGTTA